MTEQLKYNELQARQQRAAKGRRRGERTRDKLKLSAIDVLDHMGYHDMRVADICKPAGVSPATFYLYFENKTDITIHVLSEFLEEVFVLPRVDVKPATPFQLILQANLRWIKAIRANAGLMRCLLQVGDEVPEFARLNQRNNYEWYRHIALGIIRRFPQKAVDEAVALLAVYSLGAMMDEISRALVVYQDPHLLALVGEQAPTTEELAEFLSLLWYRALYAANPPDKLTGSVARKFRVLTAGSVR